MDMIVNQIQFFVASFVYGFGLMFIYDFIGAFRLKVRHNTFAKWIEDWLFWFIAAVIVFQMIFAINYGIIRSFFVLAFLSGMGLYRILWKNYVQKGILAVFTMLFRPYVWILKKLRKNGKKDLK